MSAKFAAVPAILAVAAMAGAPAHAAVPAPVQAPVAATSAGEAVSYHRYYRYRRGPSAGDVIATVLVVGGIAAAVKAASRGKDDRYRDRRYDYRDTEMRGIDRAVDMCVAAVERDARVDSVDRVERNGQGWRISGALFDGKPFTCSLGSDGRIEAIDYEGYRARDDERRGDDRYGYGYGDERTDDERDRDYDDDRQYGDDRYARAWNERDSEDRSRTMGEDDQPAAEPMTDEPQAAYPGGPVEGEQAEDGPVV